MWWDLCEKFDQSKSRDLALSVCFGSHVSAADSLTLLIKASAMVTVNRVHRRTLLLARDLLPAHHVHRNYNSLVGGRARAEAWTSDTERIMLYCTWWPSVLTTRPQGQVGPECHTAKFYCSSLNGCGEVLKSPTASCCDVVLCRSREPSCVQLCLRSWLVPLVQLVSCCGL